MDVSAFKAQLDAARSFTAEAGGAVFRLRLPTEHAWRLALERNRDPQGRVLEAQAFRALLDAALVGWESVTFATVSPASPAEPLPFSADARGLLLDHRQDIADELAVALGLEIVRRREAREAVAKN